jgi:hypothetical protein
MYLPNQSKPIKRKRNYSIASNSLYLLMPANNGEDIDDDSDGEDTEEDNDGEDDDAQGDNDTEGMEMEESGEV